MNRGMNHRTKKTEMTENHRKTAELVFCSTSAVHFPFPVGCSAFTGNRTPLFVPRFDWLSQNGFPDLLVKNSSADDSSAPQNSPKREEGANSHACIFDLDGVLVDTAKYHYLAWKRLTEEWGFAFSEADNERLKGVSRMASLDILLEVGGITGLREEEKQALADKKNTWYVEYISRMGPEEILPGVLAFLRRLKADGVKLALGSASRNAPLILERTGLKPLFDAVIDGNKVRKAKPDPEVFLLGAEALGVPACRCIVFEDAEAGVEAALRAGMKCVGVGDANILHKANIVIPNLRCLVV
jgi:beta-phosphoglucomutase